MFQILIYFSGDKAEFSEMLKKHFLFLLLKTVVLLNTFVDTFLWVCFMNRKFKKYFKHLK